MRLTAFLLLFFANYTTSEYIRTWFNMKGPPLKTEWVKASTSIGISRRRRAMDQVDHMLDTGNEMLNRLAYIYRVYLAPKAVLIDTPDCGIRNVKDTFGFDNNSFTRSESNECYWSCEWETNPCFNKRIEVKISLKSLYNRTISTKIRLRLTDPKIPKDYSCLTDSCLEGLVLRMEPEYKVFRTLWNNNNIELRIYNTSLEEFCKEYFKPENENKETIEKELHCLLFVLQRSGYFTNPVDEPNIVEEGDDSGEVTTECPPDRRCRRSKPTYYSIDHVTKILFLFYNLVESEKEMNECTGLTRKQHGQMKTVAKAFKTVWKKMKQHKRERLKAKKVENFLKLAHQKTSKSGNSRILGASADQVLISKNRKVRRYPWLCSLRSKGYRSFHKCGVTLLAVPPNPTILVSAAHCNFFCKDGSRVVETCCCRTEKAKSSCRKDPHCGSNPRVDTALPEDLNIICGEHSTEVQPNKDSPEDEVVLNVKEVINHPLFSPDSVADPDSFLNGYDISVYLVDDTPLKKAGVVQTDKIYPACLPKSDKEYTEKSTRSSRGPDTPILAGWIDPLPPYLYDNTDSLGRWRRFHNLFQAGVKVDDDLPCKDDPEMGTNTYYPPRTICARDPTQSTCVEFGTSGSPLIRTFKASDHKRYSFVGPISFSRGCDKSLKIGSKRWTRRSSNPTVITDARCYMHWISAQYGMRMPNTFVPPASCLDDKGSGDRFAKDNIDCNGRPAKNEGSSSSIADLIKCDWEKTKERYKTDKDECLPAGTAINTQNIFRCIDAENRTLVCQNDCPGVKANTIIIGGTALLATTSVAASGIVAPIAASVIGGSAYMLMRMNCLQNNGCFKRGRCGTIRRIRGRTRCVL